MARRFVRTTRALRARLRDESGFGLIEVLVSAVIVGLAVTGVFTAFDAAQATSSRNKARNVASNLAESQLEALRGMKVSQLSNLRSTTSKSVDGGVYSIVSRTDWVTDTSGTLSCTATDSATDYLKMSVTVDSNKLGAIKPVVAESIQAVPNGTFGSNQGTVIGQIIDRDGNGEASIGVTLSGGGNTYTETTNSNGCVVFGYVPTGTYTLSFSKAGWVESTYPNRQDISDSVVVSGGATSRKSYQYDQAASIAANFINSAGATQPNLHGFTVSHASLTPINFKSSATSPIGGLFPFSTAYVAWAGTCSSGNPASYSQAANTPSTALTPGGSLTMNLRQPTMTVRMNGFVGTGKITIRPSVAACSDTVASGNLSSSSTSTTVSAAFSMPYGPFILCGQYTNTSGTTRSKTLATVTNNTAAATSYPSTTTAYSLSSGTTVSSCPT
jgi:Tfp pilus assembly protein PilV